MGEMEVTEGDLEAFAEDLGRPVRGVAGVGARCVCGRPLVAVTAPRLADGTPFPTTFYLTSAPLTLACSRLEAEGFMEDLSALLASDEALRSAYEAAHQDYLDRRTRVGLDQRVGPVPEIEGITAGGMPSRIKCLHALVGHSLAAGRGVNPIGDLTLEEIEKRGWWSADACYCNGEPEGSNQVSAAQRVSAIDCGTNSIRLLVADIPEGQTSALVDVIREMVITRLGQGVDATGVLDPAALERTLAVAGEYQEQIVESGASAPRVVATSASRDASNSDDFVSGMRAITGVAPEVISGEQEAQLSFLGAISSLPETAKPPFLIVDIGGGSTEFVLGGSGAEQSVSMDMGSVRITERFGPEPWSAEKRERASAFIDAQITAANRIVDFGRANTVVGLAGTVTTLAAFIAGVEVYDPKVTHGLQPSEAEWNQATEYMITASVEDKDALSIMPQGRGDVIGGGALIWERVLKHLRGLGEGTPPTVLVSEHDILDGLALSQALPSV